MILDVFIVIGSIVLLTTIVIGAGIAFVLARAIEVANAVYEECDRP